MDRFREGMQLIINGFQWVIVEEAVTEDCAIVIDQDGQDYEIGWGCVDQIIS